MKKKKPGKRAALFAAIAMCLLAVSGCDTAGFPTEAAGGESAAESAASSSAPSSSSQGTSKRLAKQKPRTQTADIIQAINYEYRKNPDTIGWLTVPGTYIDSSVVQSHNNVYYLRRTERGTEDIYGCYYADFECSFGPRETLSPNTVIYGHSDLKDNPDGPKFSELFRFTDENFARATPSISFSTINEHMTWEIFAVFYTDLNLEYTNVQLDSAAQTALIEQARARSLYQYDVELGENEKLLTLSTCTVKYGERPDQRFVVMARLLPKDAVAPVSAALRVNENPVEPVFS